MKQTAAPTMAVARTPALQAAPVMHATAEVRTPVMAKSMATPNVAAEARTPAKPKPMATPAATLQPPPSAPAAVANSSYHAVTVAPETKPARTIDPTVLRCLETLRDAQDPEVRHGAVRTLVAVNSRAPGSDFGPCLRRPQ